MSRMRIVRFFMLACLALILQKLRAALPSRSIHPVATERKLIRAAFAEIQEELRYQYEITYRSAVGKTSSPRKIRLEIVNPALRAEDLKISYQRIAPSSAK
jgi:hypothetical protein